MGGTYLAGTYPGESLPGALVALRDHFLAEGYTDEPVDDYGPMQNWPDPFGKDAVQVWPEPVKDMAVDWMRGWVAQHSPDGVDPDDKWGPWLAFPLESGGWHLFGWVNT